MYNGEVNVKVAMLEFQKSRHFDAVVVHLYISHPADPHHIAGSFQS